ncbi:hypothetical protein QAD02_011950 [Eretmocerus hayati]|uniref:Uncharacterized protein n=1 Tax=Eretmocerus hayati TaxID=131215 RepID=A0ACC2NY16_9HYME|nr:hypothetical protein QAD02_011950 [Eretmocerus hayati]
MPETNLPQTHHPERATHSSPPLPASSVGPSHPFRNQARYVYAPGEMNCNIFATSKSPENSALLMNAMPPRSPVFRRFKLRRAGVGSLYMPTSYDQRAEGTQEPDQTPSKTQSVSESSGIKDNISYLSHLKIKVLSFVNDKHARYFQSNPLQLILRSNCRGPSLAGDYEIC